LREHTPQLDLAGLGRPVGLFAPASFEFPGHHGHAGAIHLDVQGVDGLGGLDRGQGLKPRALPFPAVSFLDILADALGDALGVLARQPDSRQLPQVLGRLVKRFFGPQPCGLASHPGRTRRAHQVQRLVARIPYRPAPRALVARTRIDDLAQHRENALGARPRTPHRHPAARAGHRVFPARSPHDAHELAQRLCGLSQGRLAHRPLQRFQVVVGAPQRRLQHACYFCARFDGHVGVFFTRSANSPS
jgi:hypothetical protein